MTPTEQQAWLQKVRNDVPEPTRVDQPIYKFAWPQERPDFQDFLGNENFDFSKCQISTGSLERKLFVCGTLKFWAWTFDGVTPLFPGI